AVSELRPSADAVAARRDALGAELHRIEAEQANYAVAIASAPNVPALAKAMHEHEQRRLRLQQDLATLGHLQSVSNFDLKRDEQRDVVRFGASSLKLTVPSACGPREV